MSNKWADVQKMTSEGSEVSVLHGDIIFKVLF